MSARATNLFISYPLLTQSHSPPPPLLSRGRKKKIQLSCHFVMIAFCNLMGFLTKGKPVGVFSQMFLALSRGSPQLMVSDGTTHTHTHAQTHTDALVYRDTHTHTHTRYHTYHTMYERTNVHVVSVIRVLIMAKITECFLGSLRDAGLILTLPLESQQVAVLINGAWLLSSGRSSLSFTHTQTHTQAQRN